LERTNVKKCPAVSGTLIEGWLCSVIYGLSAPHGFSIVDKYQPSGFRQLGLERLHFTCVSLSKLLHLSGQCLSEKLVAKKSASVILEDDPALVGGMRALPCK
jgi:hypothetical protein